MKAIVVKECLDSERKILKPKQVISDFDKKKEKKLLDLGLVREYDEKVDSLSSEDKESAAKDEQIVQLKAQLKESIGLEKGKKPQGYKG